MVEGKKHAKASRMCQTELTVSFGSAFVGIAPVIASEGWAVFAGFFSASLPFGAELTTSHPAWMGYIGKNGIPGW